MHPQALLGRRLPVVPGHPPWRYSLCGWSTPPPTRLSRPRSLVWLRGAAMESSLDMNSSLTWLATRRESMYIFVQRAPRACARLTPVSIASYSTGLFVAWNLKCTACSILWDGGVLRFPLLKLLCLSSHPYAWYTIPQIARRTSAQAQLWNRPDPLLPWLVLCPGGTHLARPSTLSGGLIRLAYTRTEEGDASLGLGTTILRVWKYDWSLFAADTTNKVNFSISGYRTSIGPSQRSQVVINWSLLAPLFGYQNHFDGYIRTYIPCTTQGAFLE